MGDIYTIGLAKGSMNAPSFLGKSLQGFNNKDQTANVVQSELFARAYVVERDTELLAIIAADIWSGTKVVKDHLLQYISRSPLHDIFTGDNIMVCGTHTHAGPAGILDYPIYTAFGGAKDMQVVELVSKGMMQALEEAWNARVAGTIEHVTLETEPLNFIGGNRSIEAYNRNPQSERDQYKVPFETEISTLIFRAGPEIEPTDGVAGRLLGTLSWLAMHPNCLGDDNDWISGDIFGNASDRLERLVPKFLRDGDQVTCGFINSACGDISPRLAPGGRKTLKSFPDNEANMKSCGDVLAKALLSHLRPEGWKSPYKTTESSYLSGPIFTHTSHEQMSGWHKDDKQTWTGAIGLSTLAGSEIDGEGPLGLREGIRDDNMGFANLLPNIPGVSEIIGSISGERAVQVAIISLTSKTSEKDLAVFTVPLWIIVALARIVAQNIFKAAKGLEAEALDPFAPYVKGHLPKPITIRTEGIAADSLPVQVFRLGDVLIPAIPAEMTTMVGRRLRAGVRAKARLEGIPVSKVLLSCYANDYASYVTTPEEYEEQRYEGSSTLFGPHTMDAYIDRVQKLVSQGISPSH